MNLWKLSMSVLLFDGVCNLCNTSVKWVLLRDKKGEFKFAAIQSEAGQSLLKSFGLENQPLESVILISGRQAYIKSDAAIKVASKLGGIWTIALVFRLVPRPVRDAIYNWVAKNRYRWFGKQEQCLLPQPEWKDRFLN
ncbi:MAG: thiol-disulfide oxidoreductase DCC family protein [Chitinophagales bacterium]|jgi:predicted DCC family thiol-disulfide oxidoreductase YuxK